MYNFVSALSVAFFAFVLWFVYLADTGRGKFFLDFIGSFTYGDKLTHLILSSVLTLMFIAILKYRSFGLGVFRLYYGSAAMALLVLAEESSQIFIPTRTFDLFDLAANYMGIIVGSSLVYIFSRRI